MKFRFGKKIVTFGLSAYGKEKLGYILAILFLAGLPISIIYLSLLFY